MDLFLFAFSFIFSFIFIILGFVRESAVLELVGSISFIIIAIMLLTTNLQMTYVYYPYSNATLVETTYNFAEETALPVGYLFLFFGALVSIYGGKLILFGKAGA